MPRQPQTSPVVGSEFPPKIYAGTSGWAYASWKPEFYPPKTSAKKFLEFYASQLNSVEVNYTFRQLPSQTMLEGWLAATPEHFRFSFKAPQRITHFARLKECVGLVEEFVNSLEPARKSGRLGLLLFQFPPNFKADDDTHARLAELLTMKALHVPLAFEFRHESWFSEPTYDLLRRHNAALCLAETEDLQTPEVHTAKTHTCFRLRRTGGYTRGELAELAERFFLLAQEREVYAYLKHEDEPTGALNAVELLRSAAAVAARRRA